MVRDPPGIIDLHCVDDDARVGGKHVKQVVGPGVCRRVNVLLEPEIIEHFHETDTDRRRVGAWAVEVTADDDTVCCRSADSRENISKLVVELGW